MIEGGEGMEGVEGEGETATGVEEGDEVSVRCTVF